MRWLENRIPPPVVALATAGGMWGIARVAPAVQVPGILRLAVASGLAVAGLAIAGTGIIGFARAGTTTNPVKIQGASRLVTSGVFSITRNPMYVGLTAVLLGWAAFLAVPWVLLGPILFVLFIGRFQIAPEERALAAKFGVAYDDYRRKVRRWL